MSGRHGTAAIDAYVPSMRTEYLYSRCEPIMDSERETITIYSLVTRCPNDTDIETKSLCEDKPSGHDLSRFVTVSTNESLYRNIYCAQCHGIKQEDVIFWSPDFRCEQHPPMTLSMKDYLKYLLNMCVLALTPPGTGISTDAAKCRYVGKNSCPRVRIDGTVNTESIISACTRYSAPVEYQSDSRSFKNPHCAICNGYSAQSYSCPTKYALEINYDKIFNLLSVSLLMDFTGSSGITINSVYGEAKTLTICNPDETLIGGECVKPNITTSCLPQMPDEPVHFFYININITLKKFHHLYNVTTIILDSIVSKLPDSLRQDSTLNAHSRDCFERNITAWECWQVYRFTQTTPLSIDTIEGLLTFFEYDFESHYKENIHLYLTNFNSMEKIVCKFGVLKTYSSDEIDIIHKHYDEYVFIKSTKTMYRMNEIYLFVNLIPSKANINGEEMGYCVSVCETQLHNCSRVYIKPDEYTINNDGDIVIKQSALVTSRYELCNETAVVCSDWLKQVPPRLNGRHISGLQGELTLVGNCISEAFLAYTLVVHAALPSLRTVPGRCVMALSLSLFLAQLMFQLSSLAGSVFPVCVMMACLQHYFWLSSFCWMSVLAFDLSSTFSGGGKLMDTSHKEKHFRNFNIYAWSVPMAFVFTALILQFANGMSIYANELFCWLDGTQNLLIFFIAPLAITLCCNFVFFIRCVVGIYRTKKITQKARRGTKCDIFIYVKLSSLMGFTWISGFLANAVQIKEFWYVFIVCYTLQGVAIGITFGMSPRVFKMIRAKCVDRKVKSQTTSTLTNFPNTETRL